MSANVRSKLAARLADEAAVPGAPPRKNGELVFEQPWEACAFGIAVALCERKAYDWEEFRVRLIAEIAASEARGSEAEGYSYYRCWAAALERLLLEKGICTAQEIEEFLAAGNLIEAAG